NKHQTISGAGDFGRLHESLRPTNMVLAAFSGSLLDGNGGGGTGECNNKEEEEDNDEDEDVSEMLNNRALTVTAEECRNMVRDAETSDYLLVNSADKLPEEIGRES